MPWLGVDLDGTLAKNVGDLWTIGAPIPEVVAFVQEGLAQGIELKIFTARMALSNRDAQREQIQEWCHRHLGRVLEVTNEKDQHMIGLVDDMRLVQVERDTGKFLYR